MAESDASLTAPPPTELAAVFQTYQVRRDGDRVLYVGDPLVSPDAVERELWSSFHERGYEASLRREPADGGTGPGNGWVLVAEPRSIGPDGIPWTNVVLALLTIISTLLVGAFEWYRIDPMANPLGVFEAWPFVAAILGVLAIHESGHYVASRYHGVDASLPYFIPVPTLIGTMGAVIKMRGRIPSRRALFDIGAAGPIAGLVATVVVTAIGLQLDPLPAQTAAESAAADSGVYLRFNDPPLLQLIAAATGTTDVLVEGAVHPVVFGGWVGMLITFLNLLPVGQLDGGHMVRSMLGSRQRTIARAVPGALLALAAYLFFIRDVTSSVGIWALWAVMSAGLAYVGPADPIDDAPLDRRRLLIGVATFAVGVLCFTPIPFEIVN